MISFPSNTEIFILHMPVSFGCGIDGMVRICQLVLNKDPISRCYFIFLNKSRKQIRVLWFDGQGFNLSTKRLSIGAYKNWPKSNKSILSMVDFFEAQILHSNGNPKKYNFQESWKKNLH